MVCAVAALVSVQRVSLLFHRIDLRGLSFSIQNSRAKVPPWEPALVITAKFGQAPVPQELGRGGGSGIQMAAFSQLLKKHLAKKKKESMNKWQQKKGRIRHDEKQTSHGNACGCFSHLHLLLFFSRQTEVNSCAFTIKNTKTHQNQFSIFHDKNREKAWPEKITGKKSHQTKGQQSERNDGRPSI